MPIFYRANGQWVDFEKQASGIKIYDAAQGKWVDGAENLADPAISVWEYDSGKWIQMYPSGRVTYKETYKASDLKFVHNQTSTWKSDTTRGDTKCGILTTAIYTGWLGYTPAKCPVQVGRGNVDEILDIYVRYNRRGVGYWENEFKLPLVLSTLLTPSGSGTNAHNKKVTNTFYSDDPMVVVPGGTSAEAYGETTMNNDYAKQCMKNFMNYSNYSILMGYKESSNTPFVGLYGLELDVTYTSTVFRARFKNVPATYNLNRVEDDSVEMWIYKDERGMSFDEITRSPVYLSSF